MKAKIIITPKRAVLDPQGKTILSALQGLGYKSVEGVRQGKVFELELRAGLTAEQARAEQA